jgi:SAM-dependent methyltransferase
MSIITSIAHNLRLILSRKITDLVGDLEARLSERSDKYERTVDARIDERLARFEDHVGKGLDERARAIDLRLDERFEIVERRLDARLEAHERRTDKYMLQSRVETVDRTDVVLQLFELRLDQQRREIRALREALDSRLDAAKNGGRAGSQSGYDAGSPEGSEPNAQQTPAEQILSFRKMAENAGWQAPRKPQSDGVPLYHRILDWKKKASDGLDSFSDDEQEIVNYILSFIGDPAERAYATTHMRRFIHTLHRIPPPQSAEDRLLELGSRLSLAPAIKKFCRYTEIRGADFWESGEKMVYKTVKSQDGTETNKFELHNFNVECDRFPWPDDHFRVALCCELLEHLRSDPLHMLWECNRVLSPGGFLLLTTPNIASARSIEAALIGCAPYIFPQYVRKTPIDQHRREYAPYEVGVALAAAGFTVVELETEDVWLRSNPAIIELLKEINLTTENRGDNLFALARKTSAPVERYPKELYVD